MQEIPCLSFDECQKVINSIDKNQQKWLPINFRETQEKLPFFSLGVGITYIVTKRYGNQTLGYSDWAKHENSWMLEEFGWFYDRVVSVLSHFLQAPVQFNSELSIPGFHIFLYHHLFTQPLGIVHCDRQHLDLGFSGKEADLENPISFTVSLELPKSGSGIDFWDVHFREIEKVSQADFIAAVKKAEHSYHPYSVGNMVIHSGYHAHRIAPVSQMQTSDRRITMQGHGVKLHSGEWLVYW